MMASGLVCAVPTEGGHTSFISSESGLLLPPFDKQNLDQWVNHILNFISDADLREKIGNTARAKIGDIKASYEHFFKIHREIAR